MPVGSAPPSASVSPTSLSFSGQYGNNFAGQTVQVRNVGGGTLTLGAMNASPTPFSMGTTCGTSLAVGASSQVTVAFSPSAAGSYSGALTIATGAGNSSIPLSGTAASPAQVSIPAPNLNFAALAIGTSSAPQSVTVSNTGGSPLTVNSVTSDSTQFVVGSNTCASVAPGASCSVNVQYYPTSGGPASGSLALSTTGGNTSVALSGSAYSMGGTMTVGYRNAGGSHQQKSWGYLTSPAVGSYTLGTTPSGYTLTAMYAGTDYYTPSLIHTEVFFCKDGTCDVQYQGQSSITLTINGVTQTMTWSSVGCYAIDGTDVFNLAAQSSATVPFSLY